MADETAKDWNKLTVAELKEELSNRNLQTSGLKKDLVARLHASDESEDVGHDEQQEMTETTENVIDTVGFEGEQTEQVEEEPKCISIECEEAAENNECNTITEEENKVTEADNIITEVNKETEGETIEGETKEEETKGETEMEPETKEKEDGENEDDEEEEEVNMEDMVAVDETNDDDEGVEDFSHLEDDLLDSEGKIDMSKLRIEEEVLMPLPPAPMHKWVYNSYLTERKSCTLYISCLTAKDVLSPTVVEWANRAMFFCINHNKEGKGTAMLHFTSSAECKEAFEALKQNLGEEVKVTHPEQSAEEQIKKGITYQLDSQASLPAIPSNIKSSDFYHIIGSRLIFVEGAPKDTTVEQISSVFADSLLVIRLEHEDEVHKWEGKDYVFPQDIVHNTFAVEFSSHDAVNKIVKEKDSQEYKIDEEKLTVKKISELEEDYKRYHARKLREARDKKWETLEQRKKQDIGEVVLSDKDRLRLYRNIVELNKVKNAVTKSYEKSYEDKVLNKESIVVKIVDITKKIDVDTDRRMKEDLNIPELPRYMTKHTKDIYAELPHEKKKKMQKEAQDVYEENEPSQSEQNKDRSSRDMRRSRDNPRHGASGRGDRSSRGQMLKRGFRRDDRRDNRSRNDRDRFRDNRRGGMGGRRDRPNNDRANWRPSPERMEQKRRRVDDYMGDNRKRSQEPDVAAQLKGLTEVISYKMGEIERLAGGIKARERALDEAFTSFTRRGPTQMTGTFPNVGGFNAGPSIGAANLMGAGAFTQQANFAAGARYSGGDMSRSGMSSLDRRRGSDIDDRFSRF